MHVVAFNGSPRKNGNTARLVRHCLDTLESEGISTEMVQVLSQKSGRSMRHHFRSIQ